VQWQSMVGAGVSLLVAWLALLGALWIIKPDEARLRDLARLAPDLLRLFRRLAADRELPRGLRVRLLLLLGYLLLPIDLIPDVIPVVGYADDAIVAALVLRSVVRRAGPEALVRHWPGTSQGLAIVQRIAGIADSS
jgi:uncharacterized membrane protein YkvA (DUF1232 family)